MLFRIAPLSLLIASICAQAETIQLPAVVTTAARLPQAAKEVIGDVTVIDQKAIETAGAISLPELLARQPGVQISSNGGAGKSSSIFIRGNSSKHTLVLIDGIRFGSATSGSAALQHIPLAQIDRIEILRGPAASMYGSDAIGGVIQIFTKPGQKGFHPSIEIGYGSNNTVDANAGISGGNEDTRYTLSVAHFKTEGINAITNRQNSSFYDDNDGYENNSVALSVRHKINEENELGASLLQAWGKNQYDSSVSDANDRPLAQSYDYREESKNGSANIWTKNQLMPNWSSMLKFGYSIDENKNFTPKAFNDYTDKTSKIQTTQTQWSWMNDFDTRAGTFQLGAETLEQKVSGDQKYDQDQRRINSLQAGYLGRFNIFSMQFNARSDDNSLSGRKNTGSAAFSLELSDAWQVGTSFGTAFKAPTFNDLYWPNSGNPNLLPEQSINKEMFVRFNGKELSSSLTVYKNRVSNLIQWASAPTLTNPDRRIPSNVALAEMQGVTLTTDWKANEMQAGLSYDYLKGSDESNGANKGNELAHRAKYSGQVYAGITLDAWTLRAEVQAQSKRFDDAANKKELAGYALTNLSASWKINPTWSMQARINNVFDTKYELIKDYGTLGRNAMLNLRWQH
ncbi:TonB-dependent receptor domain-containing protein [Iodobacter fluviatilis]|uniref:TonB-dependent receptor n=1 Tax=Iodobacter fluviatilis TaxID=537 RepID=A0A7G3G9V6_9NEIS|nr:TonB-dependent receptor [Iodobacter fluviatilis]QBC43948.1 TonB-dependent receptor [Iodobacter fluviatilis]